MKWTREQIENIQRYGKCRVCGWPLEARLIKGGPRFGVDEPVTYEFGIFCSRNMEHERP